MIGPRSRAPALPIVTLGVGHMGNAIFIGSVTLLPMFPIFLKEYRGGS